MEDGQLRGLGVRFEGLRARDVWALNKFFEKPLEEQMKTVRSRRCCVRSPPVGRGDRRCAVDRVPIAVVWMGDAASLESGGASAPSRKSTLRWRARARRGPLDSVEDRRALVEGGPATHVQLLLRRAEASFVKLKYADAVRDYEAAEQILLNEVPLDFLRTTLGDVERNLLACYDQFGRAGDAARAAERLTWAAGSTTT